MDLYIPRIPLAEWCDIALNWATEHFSGVTRAMSAVVGTAIESTTDFLVGLPPWLVILACGLLVWRLTNARIAIGTMLGFAFLWNLELWRATLQSLVLVLVSTAFALAIGIPIGISAALSKRFWRIVGPGLDMMQTMPSFVYLIPAIPFFGLGAVSACFATIVFAMPPTIRLTALGIMQTPAELVEAADAFGSSRWQKLFKIQLPLAIPTIMAGVNQTIMLALSMVVIAAMIGAGGLGGEVWRAIQRLEAGQGFQAGIAIVVLAVILDRITQHIAHHMRRDRQQG
ncbi:proline/glycine betaine ABC transporter permease [Ancylobacter dichloromethanicus]|uniref:ABC transporter permease n=1 Tax=Ancylobacter dichloromethanicus TaxID=518825 RepID=A0A9W6J8A7_9HYPH|nr:proline/glycine betaine ABC transporter permease [Ancylobacter dichloromethanicus]MBS7554006.1 proline/glycine betaine ABC transporter permease [Ancylobacter dichloromethanicus]GLK71119.1 ABC transporter permease [Ancylobacter dichloromethanicus]